MTDDHTDGTADESPGESAERTEPHADTAGAHPDEGAVNDGLREGTAGSPAGGEHEMGEVYDPTAPDERDIGTGLFRESMGPGSSMAHLYRGEIHRMVMWRERLDHTTNWAVTVMAAILTWAFADSSTPHYVILSGIVMLCVFLVIEARRYRGYDLWRARVRKLQRNVFAKALDPSAPVETDAWRRELADDYRTPVIKITFEEALAHRLRRIYLPLLYILLIAWTIRITVFPPVREFPTGAAIGAIPGWVVIAVVALLALAGSVVAFRPRTWHANAELRLTDVDVWSDGEK